MEIWDAYYPDGTLAGCNLVRGCLSAADQAHFQMVNGQIGPVIFFKKFLCKFRLARMACAGNEKYHRFSSLYSSSTKAFSRGRF